MIWDHSTSICHLQYGRVLIEWPVISFRSSLHLTLGLLDPIFTGSFKGALNDDFFSRTKVHKLSLCWSILVVSDDYLPMRDLYSLVKWSDHGIPSNFLQRAQLGIPTPSWHIYIFVARVMFLSFQIFENIEADILAIASRHLISTEFPPCLIITDSRK